MLLFFIVAYIAGSTFADFTGYKQGLGTSSIFPDISPRINTLQIGIRNFYGISGTFLLSASYNMPQLSLETSFMNIMYYYRAAYITFAIRHGKNTSPHGGIAFTFERELVPLNESRITFAFSTGIRPFQNLDIHAGVYGIPVRTRIPLLINVSTLGGKTGILLEGEKGLSLKLLLFQKFKLSERVETYLSFSTSPNKLGIGILLRSFNLLFEPFSEIHDFLGQSGGVIVEYAPSKSYN